MVSPAASDPRPPAPAEVRRAAELLRQLAPFAEKGLRLRTRGRGKPRELSLSPYLLQLLLRLLTETAEGNAVAIVPIHAELTTQEAADLLGVSRPFLVGLLDRGEIAHRLVGTHRRVRLRDLVAYRQRQAGVRQEALDELSAVGQELDLDD